MKASKANQRLHAAVDGANEAADRIREVASDLLRRSDGTGQDDKVVRRAAKAMTALSDSLEWAAESARVSGLALRDRGRDASRALSRGERLVREDGFKGAAAHVATRSRSRKKVLALTAGGLLAVLAFCFRKGPQE